jgi:hypothetical protein
MGLAVLGSEVLVLFSLGLNLGWGLRAAGAPVMNAYGILMR